MSRWDEFLGPNAAYVLELYERYLRDPSAVDPGTRAYFARYGAPPQADGADREVSPPAAGNGSRDRRTNGAGGARADGRITASAQEQRQIAAQHKEVDRSGVSAEEIARIVAAARLARGIREYGHLAAQLDPLGGMPPGDPMLDPATHGLTDADLARLPASIVWPEAGAEVGSCADAIARLRAIYCGPLGYDFDHVQQFDERAWLRETVETGEYRQPLSAAEQRAVLGRLSEVEEFERFLHATFQGQKRFSIEGTDLLVPMLDVLIESAAHAGTREVLLGMAHRGRLNVLAHVLGKPYARIFAEFHHAPNKDLVPSEGSMGINYGWTGDVKYHLGAQATVDEGERVELRLTLADNPSHLEFVNPVVEGFTRAAQEQRHQAGAPHQEVVRALAVVIHGDAAFPGEGVVAETLNLSRLAGYATGGTIHVIVNNQIGFTTDASQSRSTLYASDLAKGFEIPIIHVNADEPEACLAATRIAFAYRARFAKDFLIDLVGYRRWGHNEGDEPSYTQPAMYAVIARHPTVRARYAAQLIAAGALTAEAAEALLTEVEQRLRTAHDEMVAGKVSEPEPSIEAAAALASVRTAVAPDALRALNAALLERPHGFVPHPRLERQLMRRREALERPAGIDWGLAESLAFASILAEGTPIRLTGQDSERGTFSQRHLVLHDAQSGAPYQPLQALPQAQASCAIYNSPLSEAAVLGFEYGYSVHAPDVLTLWEAQFGDFANAAQVVIDQFLAAARAKWRRHPALVLLLPHGYEGQGPEHSSGRIERYLQLAAEDNLRLVNCTTAAQYFHVLRAQAALLQLAPRPLVVMTPKSLLRQPRAASSVADLSSGGFQPVLDDPRTADQRAAVRRMVLCSGKIGVELAVEAERAPHADQVAIVRLEQLYPVPAAELAQVIGRYPHLAEIVWLQEEPHNMGAWAFVAASAPALLPADLQLRYAGRPERASTAEGQADDHTREQARIMQAALMQWNPADGRPGVASRPTGGEADGDRDYGAATG